MRVDRFKNDVKSYRETECLMACETNEQKFIEKWTKIKKKGRMG